MDPERRDKLLNQARMLAIGHYAVGGLIMLGSLLFAIYIVIGIFFMTLNVPTSPGDPPPMLFGGVFVAVGAIGGLLVLAMGIANLVAGINLGRLRGRTLILVVAIINLLNQPLGLILGILTLLYLVQDDVKRLFEGADDPELLD